MITVYWNQPPFGLVSCRNDRPTFLNSPLTPKLPKCFDNHTGTTNRPRSASFLRFLPQNHIELVDQFFTNALDDVPSSLLVFF